MTDFSWLGLINKLANLACLVGVAVYIVRLYLIPYIKETMEQRAYEIVLLEEEAHECVVRKKQIMQEIQEYQDNAQVLLEKIDRWKESLALQEQKRAQERMATFAASQIYLKKRADGLCQDLLQRHIFPEVMEKTKQEVTAFFEKSDRQKKYVHDLIKGLKGGNKT